MNMRLIARADLTKSAYLPFEVSASNPAPRSLAQIAETKEQLLISDQLNAKLQRYEDIVSVLSREDQKRSDLNRIPGEVAVSGAKIEGHESSFDAYLKFQPLPAGQEQEVYSVELAENGKTVFTFNQKTEGRRTRVNATVVDPISGQEFRISGPLNGWAEVTRNPPESSTPRPGGNWLSGSRGTTPP